MSRLTIAILALTWTTSLLAAGAKRRVEFTQSFAPAPKPLVELWIPTPLEGQSYQTLVSRTFAGNATSVRVVASEGAEAPFVHVRWENVEKPALTIVNVVEIEDRSGPSAIAFEADPARTKEHFLAPTAHVQTDGIVKETATKITAGRASGDAKARAIYDWIVEKTARDPDTRGCGLGDVKSTLTVNQLRGKCADLNSLFVGLARAAGVPAREVFGQRVALSPTSKSLGKEGDNSKAQHCRAEYYSDAKRGWVPVDPADVRKLILDEKLSPDDPKVKEVSERFFGSWEGTWVAFNFARDFTLEGYSDRAVNFFMYPLLAAATFRPDGVEPQETGYAYSVRAL